MTKRAQTLEATDLVVGGVYRAKRHREFMGRTTDRVIIWISPLDAGEQRELQFDSDTIRTGMHYGKTTVGAFLRWARAKVDDSPALEPQHDR